MSEVWNGYCQHEFLRWLRTPTDNRCNSSCKNPSTIKAIVDAAAPLSVMNQVDENVNNEDDDDKSDDEESGTVSDSTSDDDETSSQVEADEEEEEEEEKGEEEHCEEQKGGQMTQTPSFQRR